MRSTLLLLPLLLLPLGPPAFAADRPPVEQDPTLLGAGFMDNHPDMMYRQWGVNALHRNDVKGAMDNFRLAARYADKPAQGYLGELYWYGVNQPRDPLMAFAWMDVAAERGYPCSWTCATSTGPRCHWSSMRPRVRRPTRCGPSMATRLPARAWRKC